MRRTARALYATALAGAALGAAASGASADPAAQVSPGSVEPGGTVTITVTCDAITGTPPDLIDASSQGFEEGKVQLHRVEGTDPGTAGAASYSGTAHIPSGESGGASDTLGDPAATGSDAGIGSDTVVPDTVGPGPVGSDRSGSGASGASDAKNPDAKKSDAKNLVAKESDVGSADGVSAYPGGSDTVAPDALAPAPVAGAPVVPDPATPDDVGPDTVGPDTVGPDTVGPDDVGPDTVGPDTVGPDSVGPDTSAPGTVAPDKAGPDTTGPGTGGADGRWSVDGVCPAPQGGHGKQWTASYSVARGGTATHSPDGGAGADTGAGTGAGERPPTVQRGVRAGEGGVFTDSVPALIAGGVLIAGALGGAAHRLHRLRRPHRRRA
jgi:hypothetical protein